MSIRSKLTSAPAKSIAGLVLAVGLLALFFRGTDLDVLLSTLAGADLSLIALAAGLMLATYLLRAIRWQLLLAPLGRAGLLNCFVTTVIGFAVNFLVPPGRLGEIARPYLLARREGFSAASAFATILLERVMDLVAVVLLIGLSLLAAAPLSSSESVMSALELGGVLGLAAALGGLAVLFLLARRPERAFAWITWALRVLPKSLQAGAQRFTRTFVDGLGVMVDGIGFSKSIAVSIGIWLTIALAFWVGARSLNVVFDYEDTFLVIGFLTLGVAVPTPGGVGGYHYMCALALTTLFGTADSSAKAVALLNHAVSFLPVTLLGILLLPRAGLRLGQMKSIRTSEEPTQ